MSEENRLEFFRLVKRFNRLGCLLPALGDLDCDDIEMVAECRVILAEMNATRAAMDAVLDAEAKLRGSHNPDRPP